MDIVYLNGEAGRALVEDCRENMHKTGSCKLVGFIREDALPPLIEESNTLSPLTTEHYMNRHIYVGPDDPSSPENHPVRRFLPIIAATFRFAVSGLKKHCNSVTPCAR